MRMIVTLTPCSAFRSRSRSRSPDNNGGALNLDTKSTKAMTSTTTDDEEATYEQPSPTAIESSELRSRLQEAINSSIAAEPVASGSGSSQWRRQRYDSTEEREPHIEVENDSEEPQSQNLHNPAGGAGPASSDVIASAATEEQPLSSPKNNRQIPIFKPSHMLPYYFPSLLYQQHQTSALYSGLMPPVPGLFNHFAPIHSRIFTDEPSSYHKDLPSDPRQPSPSRTTPPKGLSVYHHPSRVDPSHPHQSSAAAVASIH